MGFWKWLLGKQDYFDPKSAASIMDYDHVWAPRKELIRRLHAFYYVYLENKQKQDILVALTKTRENDLDHVVNSRVKRSLMNAAIENSRGK